MPDLVLVESPFWVADAVLVFCPVFEASVLLGSAAVPLAGIEAAASWEVAAWGWPVTAPPELVWVR